MTELEKSVIASILMSNDCIPSILATGITVEHFSAGGQDIFRVVLAMYDRGSAIDSLTLPDALADTGRYDVPDKQGEVQTAAERRTEAVNKAAAEITTWLESLTNTAYAVDHVKGVIRAARRRQQDELIAEAIRLRDAPTTSPDDLRSHFELMLEQDDRIAVSNDNRLPPFVTSGVPFDDFCSKDIKQEYLISRVLSRREELVFGAPDKTLKTCLMADMAVSLATGTPFLGYDPFSVPEPVRVCFMTLETGEAALQSICRRVVRARQLNLEDVGKSVVINQELPIIANDWHMRELIKYIDGEGFDAVMIDPAYLTLFDEGSTVQAGNLLEMGPLLRRLTVIRKQTGVTFGLAHHTRKPPNKDFFSFHKTTRDDLSQSGFKEWMRQWALLSRKVDYKHDGHHLIHLEFGGSSGHGGEYVLQVDEGKKDNGKNQSLTDWQTIVTPSREFNEAARAVKEEHGESKKDETLERNVLKVRNAMKDEGVAKKLSKHAITLSSSLNDTNTGKALYELKRRGEVEMDDSNPNRVKWTLKAEPDKSDT